MRLYPKGGYLNPGYGAWGVGVTIQATVALCLLLLACGHHEGPHPNHDADRPHRIPYANSTFFNLMGALNIVGAVVTGLVVIVGYLVLPFVLCPITLITILNWCVTFSTAGCCSYIFAQVQHMEKTRLHHLRHPELGPMREIDSTEVWARQNQRALMSIAGMCIVLAPCYFAGLVYSKGSTTGTRATTWFYVSGLMLLSGMFVILMRGLPTYSSISFIWFILWVLMLSGIVLQQCCWYRLCAVLLGVIFAMSAVYSLVVWIVLANAYTHTKKYTFAMPLATDGDISRLTETEYSWVKVTSLSASGQYLICECASSACICLMAVFAMLYALYSVFSKKPPEAGKAKKDSTEEAQHAEEKVELNQQEPATADNADQP